MNITFVTGNDNKAKYFSEIIGMNIDHEPADVLEIQSIDLAEIVEYKARAAYEQIKRPLVVEDTKFVINSLGNLPGPFIKWFEKEMGLEKICRLADIDAVRSAKAGAAFAYYDGQELKIIQSEFDGTISDHPQGGQDFGWSPIFIPIGSTKTLAEMDDKTFKEFYVQIKPFRQLKAFLTSLDKA